MALAGALMSPVVVAACYADALVPMCWALFFSWWLTSMTVAVADFVIKSQAASLEARRAPFDAAAETLAALPRYRPLRGEEITTCD